MDVNGLSFWMLSQQNDWLTPWRAQTPYLAGQALVDPNGNIQTIKAAGISDASIPNWNPTLGQTTTDASLTWVNSGPITWSPSLTVTAGQYLLDPNNNLQLALPTAGGTAVQTGTTAPLWGTSLGQTVVDGGMTWRCVGPPQPGLMYCPTTKRLMLRSMRTGTLPAEDFFAATNLVNTVPIALDQYATYARWDTSSGMVVAGGAGPQNVPPPDEVPIYRPVQPNVTDLAMGYDGILYIAAGGTLVMVDRRNRWPDFTLILPSFNVWRLAALPDGGVLALDRAGNQVGQIQGQPLQTGPVDVPDPGILRPCQSNPNPPRLVSRFALPTGEQFVALAPVDATNSPGQFALLSWQTNDATNTASYLRTCTATALNPARLQLSGSKFTYAIAGLGSGKIAALVSNLNEAVIYNLNDADSVTSTASLLPGGDSYILAAANLGPFAHSFDMPPQYANAGTASPTPAQPLLLPLLPLSLNSVAATAATSPAGPSVIDSGTFQNTWHRLFVEAIVPSRCGAIVWLAASDSLADLSNQATTWFPHLLGNASLSSIPTDMLADAPTLVWQTTATEVPFAPTMLGAEPTANTQGLFMALVQRADRRVRSLSGRFLGVRIQLNGDGRNTPEIAALRIYGSRFSYVQNYLPEIYREQVFGTDGDVNGPSTRPDFFERFVDLFESQFTRIEDGIANSYLLTRPESTPDAALPWLGAWIGVPEDNYPPGRMRARLKATPSLYRWRGTTKGITEALDVATGGLCRSGAIVLIEDFRLRHVFATILGANLAITDDPLLPGYSGSDNSFVGDTLFLGDKETQAQLQALFATNLNIAGGTQAAEELYDSLANRLTVFVHDQVQNVDLKLVQRIVEWEKPAHVAASVVRAKQPLMVGLASLLGVNTYLAPEPEAKDATIGVSDVGRYDVVTHAPALDPRMENGRDYNAYALPIARITGPAIVLPGQNITLNASASTSPSGTTIQSYSWTLVPSPSTT